MNTNLRHAVTPTPTPDVSWKIMKDDARLRVITTLLEENSSSFGTTVFVTSTRQDGQVICGFKEPICANRRGTILLDLEEILKTKVDQGITVWLEPLGDKNSLRNLRGIEVKS